MFDGEAVELRLRGADILVDVAQAGRRKRHASRGARQRTGIRTGHGDGLIGRAIQDNHGIVRRVLDHVECDVAEVALVAYAGSAANRGLATPEHVIRKSDARRNRSVLRLP